MLLLQDFRWIYLASMCQVSITRFSKICWTWKSICIITFSIFWRVCSKWQIMSEGSPSPVGGPGLGVHGWHLQLPLWYPRNIPRLKIIKMREAEICELLKLIAILLVEIDMPGEWQYHPMQFLHWCWQLQHHRTPHVWVCCHHLKMKTKFLHKSLQIIWPNLDVICQFKLVQHIIFFFKWPNSCPEATWS